MSAQHLLALAITPVQRFIREARKAQDLWSSSLLLSLMAARMARALATRGATLITPHLGFDPRGAPSEPHRPRLTNEVKALFLGEQDGAEMVAALAAADTHSWWVDDVAGKTRQRLLEAELFGEDELRLWDDQVRAQFRVVWAAVSTLNTTEPSGAAQSFERLEALLAGAKQCRTVGRYLGDCRPKCTLCGQWEQMGPAFPDPDPRAMTASLDFWRGVEGDTFPMRLRRLRDDQHRRYLTTPLMEQSGWRSIDLYGAVNARLRAVDNERLCAVCLTKRLAPVLVFAPEFGWCPDDTDSPLRFPSTTAIAWEEQKLRLASQACASSPRFIGLLDDFRLAVDGYANATGLARGRHWFPAYRERLEELPQDCRGPFRKFLELDGSWLNFQDRGSTAPTGRPLRRAEDSAAWTKLEQARKALRDEVSSLKLDGVNLIRTPPLALLRADADRLGKRISAEITKGGLAKAEELSRVLARKAMTRAVESVEGLCGGKVIFADGDELLAMLPAVHALRAAEEVALAYSEEATTAHFPGLTSSVAIAVIHAHEPLRLAIEQLNELLEDAKKLARPAPWLRGPTALLDRHAFGLAITPGSGNVKRGVVGLELPIFAEGTRRATGTCRTVGDVLRPLAEIFALPEATGVRVSPKLYREWGGIFELPSMSFESGPVAFPDEFLPDDGVEGMALAEFGRLACRHVEVAREFRRGWSGALIGSVAVEFWFRTFLGEPAPDDADAMRERIVQALKWRLRSLLLSGSVRDRNKCEPGAQWDNVAGLLLGVTSLGTREIA